MERFFQTPKDYRKNPVRQFHKRSKEVEQDLELKVKHLEMELEYTKLDTFCQVYYLNKI